MTFEVLAEGLEFPEGPIAFPDGSVILVEIQGGRLTRVHNGKKETIAELGGGPNGAALGPDGAVYVCNNGGMRRDTKNGWVERVNVSTGKSERVVEKVGDNLLNGPNDIVFDEGGGFWFSDYGSQHGRVRDLSGIYYAQPGGKAVEEISWGGTGYNGIGLSPDEKIVYAAETFTGRLIAFDLDSPGVPVKGTRAGRVVGAGPGRTFFDSLALQANGDVCVASIAAGITTITAKGDVKQTPLPDRMVTNICFGGADMRDAYITMSGVGQLIKLRWPEPGLKLNFSS